MKTNRIGKRIAVVAVALITLCTGAFTACGHTHSLERTEAKAPTCVSQGCKEYYKCTECGETFSDAEGKNAVDVESLKLDPIPHDYSLKVKVAEGEYTAGENLTSDKLSFSLYCGGCKGTESVSSGVTVDLSKPLVEGVNTFTASYNGKNATFTVTAKAAQVSDSSLSVECGKIFHAGQSVKPDDLTVTLTEEGKDPVKVSGFEITNSELAENTTEIEVSYNGLKAKTPVTVHAVTHESRVESTTETEGTVEHYACAACGKNFDKDFNELETVKIPLMQAFSITDSKIRITNSDGKTVGLKTEQGKTFLSGNPSDYYGRIFIEYNLTVENDTAVKFYVNTCTRDGANKVSDVYSVKINGEAIDSGERALPQGTNNWFSQDYTLVGGGMLIAGRNNLIEVTRVNLINKALGGALTYNYFGIGITPEVSGSITLNATCTHKCAHCGKCTESGSESSACAEKCAGHEGEHFCAHVCGICGECKDSECTDAACSGKCGCTEFTVMHDSVTVVNKDGGTVNKNTAANEQNVSANDSSAKKGLIKITYKIHSDKAATVKLYIKTCSQTLENTLAESYTFSVEGTPVEVDGNIKMPHNEANKWKDIRYTCVGEITLVEGDNTIEIVRLDMTERELNDYTGYNFFGIALSGDVGLTWVQQ